MYLVDRNQLFAELVCDLEALEDLLNPLFSCLVDYALYRLNFFVYPKKLAIALIKLTSKCLKVLAKL